MMSRPAYEEPSYQASRSLWFLDGIAGEGQQVRRVPILALPFTIGRRPGRGLTLSSPMISGRHAEIFDDDGVLKLRDLGSTNGTSLNGRRLHGESRLEEGDVLHFAKLEFRLCRVEGASSTDLLSQTVAVEAGVPEPIVARSHILRQTMKNRSVRSFFQPIVALADTRLLGYESLGRTLDSDAAATTSELFKLAAVLGAEADLSQLLREESVADARRLPSDATLFINTHPKEIGTPELEASLARFRRDIGDRSVVVEIHEATVTDSAVTGKLGRSLANLGFAMAYDDFGAGQTRLVELTELPPDFLKFDVRMVRDLATAAGRRRKLVASLTAMARELGIRTVAEGIETAADAAACGELGFDYGQGFYFGRPLPVGEIAEG